MTLRHMKIFLAVWDHQCNTTKAAQALFMTQPAVSLAIKELEQYYGVRLFERMGRRLQPTQAGAQLREYALTIVTAFADMEQHMRSWDSLGLLRVGASVTIGSQFLPTYVKDFSAQNPGVQVQVLVAPSEQLEGKILCNELDVALIEGAVHAANLISQPYMEDKLTVICPADGPFRQGQVLTLEEFKHQSFLLREPGSGTREVFDRVTESAGFSVHPIWEAMSTTALVNGVMQGLGIAVLPQQMVASALRSGQVISVDVEGLDFRRLFSIIYHKDKYLSPMAKAFVSLCQASAQHVPAPEYTGLY